VLVVIGGGGGGGGGGGRRRRLNPLPVYYYRGVGSIPARSV
jgi:hypothetical protein